MLLINYNSYQFERLNSTLYLFIYIIIFSYPITFFIFYYSIYIIFYLINSYLLNNYILNISIA